MAKNESQRQDFDWNLTTFDGSRREQLRRWARLPLEQVIAALEEMQELSDKLAPARNTRGSKQAPAAATILQDTPSDYHAKTTCASGSNESHDE